MATLVSFRSGSTHGELGRRGSASLAAKFATQRYLAIMSQYRDRARSLLTEDQRRFLYDQVLPRVDLALGDVVGILHAYAERLGADSDLVNTLYENGKHEPILIEALIDDYRVETQGREGQS